jgi:TolB protein
VRALAAVFTLAVAAACVSEPTAPHLSGQSLLFTSDRDGNVEIYSMHADGRSPVRLTRNGATDFSPRWSPNGERIVFLSNRAPGANGSPSIEVFAMNGDGSGVTRLTTNDVLESSPGWSPDGTRILYSTDGHRSKIFVMNADGSDVVQLTNNEWADSVPRWSPDGSRIAFLGNPLGLQSILTMNPDGTNPVRVPTQAGGKLKSYSWSPDSKHIVYEYGEWPYGGIYRTLAVPTPGVGPIFLVGWENFPGKPVWSPDGTRIAFTISITGEAEIYTMRATDGGDRRNITNNPAEDFITDWK